MAYTQADLDAAEATLATMTEQVRHGDKSVSYADTEAQLKRINYIRRQMQSPKVRRCTFADLERDL